MSESKKLWIGLGVVLVLCCCTAGMAYFGLRQFGKGIQNAANGDPTSVAQIQVQIAGFDIPPGYQPFAMHIFNYDMVTLAPENSGGGMMIMLIQLHGLGAASREQTELQLRQIAAQQNSQPGTSMQVVDTHEEVIRGETVTVTVSEGQYESLTMRQWTTIFAGNKGPTMLMVQGAVESWDDQLLEDFIKSIH